MLSIAIELSALAPNRGTQYVVSNIQHGQINTLNFDMYLSQMKHSERVKKLGSITSEDGKSDLVEML